MKKLQTLEMGCLKRMIGVTRRNWIDHGINRVKL